MNIHRDMEVFPQRVVTFFFLFFVTSKTTFLFQRPIWRPKFGRT